MRLRVRLAYGEGFRRRLLYFWPRVHRSDVSIGEPQPRLGNSRPGPPKLWIYLKRLFKQDQAVSQTLLVGLVREIKSLEVEVVRGGVRLGAHRRRNRQSYFKCVHNGPRDFVLDGENTLQFSFVGVGPNVK